MRRIQANGLLFVAALFWGSGNVAQKTILADIGPFTAVGLRCLIATLVLAPILGWSFKRSTQHIGQRKQLHGAMVVLTFAIALTLYQIATGLTTVTNSGFLVNISTVITPIFAWLLLKNAPGFFIWPAAGLTLFGVYFMSGEAFSRFNAGDALALSSAVFYSVWMISLGQFVVRYGQAGIITLVQFLATGVVCIFLGFALETISLAAIQSVLAELLFLGVVSTGLGYLLQAIAQGHTSASETAVIVSGEAIFGAIFAFILLGETLDGFGMFGAVLILCGIATVQLGTFIKVPSLYLKGDQS